MEKGKWKKEYKGTLMTLRTLMLQIYPTKKLLFYQCSSI